MKTETLPEAVQSYIDASNAHHIQHYIDTFSEHAVLIEESIGRDLAGKEEIKDYFVTYFVKTSTNTEILEYTINGHTVDMKVMFKGNFAGGEIRGLYRFELAGGKIIKLTADLE
ncbi:hypothetical protein AWM70_04285 [Paenibacillus yonginensis]|uniref:SnoaL-like domain-containing protein n=1 Tax=Paenibacillus yonginensis TaxID=1462996 RepID=A0A1B1MXJ3_9BACL|nr:nuclear transport factor 2 family protein [Paenibacillus yonginensis]ANS73886.1 hypothetical protein AWM70_04285 [Paenibacillus yonginensis]